MTNSVPGLRVEIVFWAISRARSFVKGAADFSVMVDKPPAAQAAVKSRSVSANNGNRRRKNADWAGDQVREISFAGIPFTNNSIADVAASIGIIALIRAVGASHDFFWIACTPILAFEEDRLSMIIGHGDDVGRSAAAVLNTNNRDGAIATRFDGVEGVLETLVPIEFHVMALLNLLERPIHLIRGRGIGIRAGQAVDEGIDYISAVDDTVGGVDRGNDGRRHAGFADHYGEAAEDDDAAVDGGVTDAGGHEVADEDGGGAHENCVGGADAGGHIRGAGGGEVAD